MTHQQIENPDPLLRTERGDMTVSQFVSLQNSIRRELHLKSKLSRFLPVARSFAEMSKYTGTKVGAIILGPSFEIRGSGWNGAPRGSAADCDHRTEDRATRLLWAAHAEANAIAQAARAGTALEGCQMVVTFMPCASCAKLIVQAGINRVACPEPDAAFRERWKDELEVAEAMFKECGVELLFLKEEADV